MNEMHDQLHRHYALILGVKSPRDVNGVNLDIPGRQVEIRLEWAMGNTVACAEFGRQCTVADQKTADALWQSLPEQQKNRLAARR